MEFWQVIIIVLIAVGVGALLLNYLEGGKLFRPAQWELVQENVSMTEKSYPVVWGPEYTTTRQVRVDVYRKKRRDGTYKYKNVKRN